MSAPRLSPTEFDYLLNAFERASQSDKPAENGYAEKRRKLFAYVRDLEQRSLARSMEQEQGEPVATFRCWTEPSSVRPEGRQFYEFKLTARGNALPDGEYSLSAPPPPPEAA